MKKRNILICLFMFVFLLFSGSKVEAKTVAVVNKPTTNVVGETLARTEIYSNGKIAIRYKYGLRKVNVYYCKYETVCDTDDKYNVINVMESSKETPYKNDGEEMDTYSYQLKLEKGTAYRIKVEIYVGSSNSYTGEETVFGLCKDTIDTLDSKIVITSSNNNKHLGELMDRLTEITNSFILPILFSVLGVFLVIKGAILGVQIVKSADHPDIRSEKIRALKWLVIGVFIAYAASGLVGVITGYFESMFK